MGLVSMRVLHQSTWCEGQDEAARGAAVSAFVKDVLVKIRKAGGKVLQQHGRQSRLQRERLRQDRCETVGGRGIESRAPA